MGALSEIGIENRHFRGEKTNYVLNLVHKCNFSELEIKSNKTVSKTKFLKNFRCE